MVSRVEGILAGLLGLALLLGLSNQQEIIAAKKKTNPNRKEMEMREASVREVNRTTVLNEFSASHAVMIRNVWYLDDFRLRNPDIMSLQAQHAVRGEEQIRMEGNVTLHRYDHSVYEAHKVLYDTRHKILRSIGPFYAYRGADHVRGIDFLYEVVPQRTYAEKVFAHYRLAPGAKGLR